MPPSEWLKLRVPPLAVLALAAAMVWTVDRTLPQFAVATRHLGLMAATLVLTGGIVCLMGIIGFRRAKTTVDPMRPERAANLVIAGIYRQSRNPMYLGLLLVLAGCVVYAGNVVGVVVLPGFVWFLNRFQIGPEEDILRRKFGPPYKDYLKRVKRWW